MLALSNGGLPLSSASSWARTSGRSISSAMRHITEARASRVSPHQTPASNERLAAATASSTSARPAMATLASGAPGGRVEHLGGRFGPCRLGAVDPEAALGGQKAFDLGQEGDVAGNRHCGFLSSARPIAEMSLAPSPAALAAT
jgi:hypothetical protein